MGSSVSTSSNAVDNRLAVTDNALGINNYGGKTAYAAPIFDFSQKISTSGKNAAVVAGRPGGNGVNISILDAGAINRAFDFADGALSEFMGAVINSQNQAAAQAASIADTTATALQQSTEAAQAAQDAVTGNYQRLQKWAVVCAVGAGLWWAYRRGRK